MSKSVEIRMYNVGFGDCFLLKLPDNKTVLVDAGFHSQGKGKFGGNELAEQIIKDLVDFRGEARIDVIIATHRHQDHIYAFNSEKWSEVEIGEVWLPWVEDRSNNEATRLWKKQQRFAMNLYSAIPQFELGDEDRSSIEFILWNAGIDLQGFDAGGWSNAKALDCLHEGFARRERIKPRFLPETETLPETFESSVLPGVRVHVLGPPRNPDLIKDLDPEADGETYRTLALLAADSIGDTNELPSAPFGKAWQVPDSEQNWILPLQLSEKERMNDLARSTDAVFAAQSIDSMINSTSLVIMLEIGKAMLLLPGDAEWGTWKRILEEDEARILLRGATFFKVGHHGSHNATSKTLIEKVLPRGIPAMISTQEGEGKYRNNIPLSDLLDALTGHDIYYVRSDRGDENLPDGFEQGDEVKWIDLELTC